MKVTASLTPTPPQLRPKSSHPESRSTPAIIPLDYSYQTMSPTSSLSRNFYQQSQARSAGSAVDVDIELADAQFNSIFGDPVPPPPTEDFFDTQFPHAAEFLRRPSMIQLSSEEEVEFSAAAPSGIRRLFSNVPYSSSISRRLSNVSYSTHLQPPEIQILPQSSGGSSSEARDSPNYALLAPDDIMRRPALYDIVEPANTTELKETITIKDATGLREFSEATRRVSNFSEDFKSNVGSLGFSSPPPDVPELPKTYTRQFSNESCSSSEWFRPSSHGLPNFPEFTKMPRLRPSSKNVMSIKRDEMPVSHSPVAAMINDSNGSSSGEERLMGTTVVLERPTLPLPELSITPEQQPDPSATYRYDSDMGLLLSPQQYLQQRRTSVFDVAESISPLSPAPPPLPPVPPPPDLDEPFSMDVSETSSMRRSLSPAIITDSIATGGEFRVDQARLHKKTAFTIISNKSPSTTDSRAQSAVVQHHKSQISPFLGYGFKETPAKTATTSASISRSDQAQLQNQRRKSFSASHLKLPQLRPSQHTLDDSPRPSVQFNMTGRRSPSKMPQKGILQRRESVSSLQEGEAAALPASQMIPPKALPSSALAYGPRMKSCETLPLITDPYRTAIPRLNRSALELRRESPAIPPGALPRPIKPNPNPTRKQRGLLRIFNSADSGSRIPLRSKWSSMEDLALEPGKRRASLTPFTVKARRRSSSTSPERRSSTQTASDRRSSNLSSVTTSDFSFRRASFTPQPQRRKSIAPGSSPLTKRRPSIVTPATIGGKSGARTTRGRIAKPSTLSPIIGTPNKDSSSPQSPAVASSVPASESTSDSVTRRGSVSKIPVRNGNGVESRSNSQLSSHADSRHESRSSSPVKDFSGSQILQSLPTSRAASSRSPSRATVRTESRASTHSTQVVGAASRSTSRASTKPISRGGSRASSRQRSRMEQARSVANSRSNSRSNSRLSQASVLKTGSASLSPELKRKGPIRRRKSVSLSPKRNRRTALIRRNSLSPDGSKRGKSSEQQRRNSRSRIPMPAKNGVKTSTATKLPPKTNPTPTTATSIIATRGSMRRKEPASAKKAPTSVRKPESSVKRTPSSVKKAPTDATKKPSPLQKTASRASLKRETSNVQKKTSAAAAATAVQVATAASKPLQKEPSSVSLKRGGTAGEIKRPPPSVASTVTTAAKVSAAKKAIGAANKDNATPIAERSATSRTPSAGTNKAETPKKPPTASAENVSKTGDATGTGTDSGSAASTNSLKRQVTKLRLIRAGSKLSLLSRKRSETNLSRKFDAETSSIAEEIEIGAQGEEMSTQIVDHPLNTADDIATLPSAILEKSQKTLETVQKTVTEATDEIQKTISENLTDLKSLADTESRNTASSGGGGVGGGVDAGAVSSGAVVGGGYESASSPSPSVATVVENKPGKGSSVSRLGTAERSGAAKSSTSLTSPASATVKKSPAPPTQPIEAAVSVVNGAKTSVSASNTQKATTDTSQTTKTIASAAGSSLSTLDTTDADLVERNYELGIKQEKTEPGVSGMDGIADADMDADGSADARRRSPDGQGGSTDENGDKTGSQEFLEKKHKDDNDEDGKASKRSCCSCCTKLCMPCRRMRCSHCCRRKKSTSALTTASNNNNDDDVQPVLTPPSSAGSATNVEIVNEKQPGCWQKLNCCKRKKKKNDTTPHEPEISPSRQQQQQLQQQQQPQMETIHEEVTPTPEISRGGSAKQSKCGLCLSKFFCCRSVNKVKTTTSGASIIQHARDEPRPGKCCFCIPWKRKRARGSTVGSMSSGTAAWQDPESGITSTDASVLEGMQATERRPGCCRRFWCCLPCRKKKPPPVAAAALTDSRRASMKAAPPTEDTRRKLHVDLVEYNSKMKGAIPVLPLYLAWFCALCNTLIPGLGTLLSGIFCVCIGIPRFSHYDSAKARLGALIINTIVAFSQLFCVLFCFVGWGWSIWWGTIMLKCARKLSKIRKVERMEMEEERRQSDQAAAATATAATRAILASEIEAAKQ